MRFLILIPLLLTGCAAPGESKRMSDAVALGLAMGPAFADVIKDLPPEAWGGYQGDIAWYDRTLGIQVDSQHGDNTHFVDITGMASGESAVRDNQTRASVAQGAFDVFGQGLQMGLAAASSGLLGGGRAVTPDPIGQAVGGFLAREGRLPNAAELDALYRSLQTLGQPLAPTQPTPPTPTQPQPTNPPGFTPGPGGN